MTSSMHMFTLETYTGNPIIGIPYICNCAWSRHPGRVPACVLLRHSFCRACAPCGSRLPAPRHALPGLSFAKESFEKGFVRKGFAKRFCQRVFFRKDLCAKGLPKSFAHLRDYEKCRRGKLFAKKQFVDNNEFGIALFRC